MTFEKVKALICNAPVLSAPLWDCPLEGEVDASQMAARAVLLQAEDLGVDRPLCLFHKN